jgi:CubicO group peptidase (beta-lactamase class C family)
MAGRVVAKAEGAADWNAVLREELLDRLGMKHSSYTAEAIKAAPNHAEGYRYAPDGRVEVPFTQFFPYNFGGAGDINSDIEDMAHWVRLHLGKRRVGFYPRFRIARLYKCPHFEIKSINFFKMMSIKIRRRNRRFQ